MLKFILEKEFKQIFRNPLLPKLIIGLPVVMMLVLPWAANQEIKNLRLSVVDNDHSTFSERLTNKIAGSRYFQIVDVSASNREAMQSVDARKADMILEIEPEFEQNLRKAGIANVMISANAVNGVKGGLGSVYIASIISDFSTEITAGNGQNHPPATICSQFKFNPRLDYKVFMVPALFVMLLTILTGFLPALNIVGEKELGTTEQLNVTPMSKSIFILGKLIPFWIIGFFVLSAGIIVAALIYDLFPAG
ncbi:MAG: ABC transporter permease, partial [Dysgonamonadaceae bacterium]|nr:ABC transporter permease [Dysgonamonadaceae bacterium]